MNYESSKIRRLFGWGFKQKNITPYDAVRLKKSEYDLLGEKAHSPPNIIIFNFSDAYSFDTMDRSFDLPILVFLQK